MLMPAKILWTFVSQLQLSILAHSQPSPVFLLLFLSLILVSSTISRFHTSKTRERTVALCICPRGSLCSGNKPYPFFIFVEVTENNPGGSCIPPLQWLFLATLGGAYWARHWWQFCAQEPAPSTSFWNGTWPSTRQPSRLLLINRYGNRLATTVLLHDIYYNKTSYPPV